MKLLFGLILVALGVIVFFFGPTPLNIKQGRILRTMTWGPLRAKMIAWIFGMLLAWVGLTLVLGR